jgi:hypothetical protein
MLVMGSNSDLILKKYHIVDIACICLNKGV